MVVKGHYTGLDLLPLSLSLLDTPTIKPLLYPRTHSDCGDLPWNHDDGIVGINCLPLGFQLVLRFDVNDQDFLVHARAGSNFVHNLKNKKERKIFIAFAITVHCVNIQVRSNYLSPP